MAQLVATMASSLLELNKINIGNLKRDGKQL